jgi:hypothetical protein
MMKKPDVMARSHGSVWMFEPVSPRAKEWVKENVAVEGWAWMGPAFAVDHRYADNLISGMVDAGMEVCCP